MLQTVISSHLLPPPVKDYDPPLSNAVNLNSISKSTTPNLTSNSSPTLASNSISNPTSISAPSSSSTMVGSGSIAGPISGSGAGSGSGHGSSSGSFSGTGSVGNSDSFNSVLPYNNILLPPLNNQYLYGIPIQSNLPPLLKLHDQYPYYNNNNNTPSNTNTNTNTNINTNTNTNTTNNSITSTTTSNSSIYNTSFGSSSGNGSSFASVNAPSSVSLLSSPHSEPLSHNHMHMHIHGSNAKLSKSQPRKKRECPICHNYYSNLTTHKTIHNKNLKPFICKTCNRAFKRMNDLIRHEKCHLSKLGEWEFQCPFHPGQSISSSSQIATKSNYCHHTGCFTRCDTYKNHLKAIHFKYPPNTLKNDRLNVPGHCKECGEGFNNVQDWLINHIETNSCPKFFKNSK